MLPTLKSTLPSNGNWAFEIKYDGFRAMLEWNEKNLYLWSRNEVDLLPQFPEIKEFLLSQREKIKDYLPITLDGELVILENPNKANFGQLQIRGRMRSKERILEKAYLRPARYLVFDLLKIKGNSMMNIPFMDRKSKLQTIFEQMNFPLRPSNGEPELLQLVPFEKKLDVILEKAFTFDSEGIVAKLLESKWEIGKRTETWVKIKNWKKVSCFITAFDSNNGYYHIGVFDKDNIIPLGLFLFSISPDQKQALNQVIKENAYENNKGLLKIHPSICIEVQYLEWYEESLREQLAVIRVLENTLLMETIHFPDEVRNAADVPNVPAEDQVSKKEIDTAILLIDQLTTTFEPEKYTDEYRSKLMELIESKRTGKELVTPKEKKQAANVTDLMAALQASIDKTKGTTEEKPKPKRRTTRTKKAQ